MCVCVCVCVCVCENFYFSNFLTYVQKIYKNFKCELFRFLLEQPVLFIHFMLNIAF